MPSLLRRAGPADPAASKSALPAALRRAGPLLPALRATAQLSAMKKAFVAIAGSRAKPLALPGPAEAAPEHMVAAGEVAELVVIAVRRVIRVGGGGSSSNSERGRGRSRWTATFSMRADERRVQCALHYGEARKHSRAAESSAGVFAVDEKFAFARREGDPTPNEAVLELLAPPAAGARPPTALGRLVIDVARELRAAEADPAAPAAPVHRSAVLAPAGGSAAAWEVHYVLHRLPVETADARAAASRLAGSARAVDDDGDLEAFGAALPRLWYMF